MVIRRTSHLLLACTTLSLLPLAAPAWAQDAAGTTQLETIVVKGKRAPAGAVADTPLASQTSAEVIAKKEIKNLSDLANTTEPGLEFIKSRPGSTGGLYLRGLTGARVSTLVDDIPLPFMQSSARSGTQSPTTGISVRQTASTSLRSVPWTCCAARIRPYRIGCAGWRRCGPHAGTRRPDCRGA